MKKKIVCPKGTDAIGTEFEVGAWCVVYKEHELKYGQILKINARSLHIQLYDRGGGFVNNPNYGRATSTGERDNRYFVIREHDPKLIKRKLFIRRERSAYYLDKYCFNDVIIVPEIKENKEDIEKRIRNKINVKLL